MKLKQILVMLVTCTLALSLQFAAHCKDKRDPIKDSYMKQVLEKDKFNEIPEPHDLEIELPDILKKQSDFGSNLHFQEKMRADLIPSVPLWDTWNVVGKARGQASLFQRNVSLTGFVGQQNRTNSFNVWITPSKELPADTDLVLYFVARAERLNNPNALPTPVSRAMQVSCSEIGKEFSYWKASVPLTTTARFYQYQFKVPKTPTQRFRLLFQINEIQGLAEIGDVHLFYDENMFHARAMMRPDAIDHRIDLYRKANLHVLVQDKSGKPVTNATVSVQQTRHEFLFGCTIFGLAPLDKSPNQINFQKQFLQLFNWCGLNTFINTVNPAEGKRDYAIAFEEIKWCREHGIDTFANALISVDNIPEWLKRPKREMPGLLRTNLINTVKTLSPEVSTFIVASDLSRCMRQKDAISDWVQSLPRKNSDIEDQPMNALELILNWAHNADPSKKSKFLYGMYETQRIGLFMKYKEAFGPSPDGVAICRWNKAGEYEDLNNLWKCCDECKNLDKPLPVYAPRIAVLNGKQTNNDKAIEQANIKGEAAQADYIVNLYRTLFSHPSVQGIAYDNMRDWDPKWDPPRALIRYDGTPKPAFYKLLDLIHNKWWTTVKGTTDNTGIFTTKAFYGDYVITVKDNSGRSIQKTFKVSKDRDREKRLVMSL
jgi:endo-1,4-beta-xylanase